MLPEEMIKEIAKKARDKKLEKEDPDFSGQAKKAAVRKLMDAIKSEDDDMFMSAFNELKVINED